jgi:chemotaxis signal transduction protein
MSNSVTHEDKAVGQAVDQAADHSVETCWRVIGTRGDQSCPKLVEYLRCMNCPVYHDTAQSLLERLPVRLDEDPDAAEPADDAQSVERFNVLVFRLEGEWLAMPTRVLDEVGELRQVHAVPHRRRGALLGLVNVRGVLTPCVSLARLLSLPADTQDRTAQAERGRMLIVKDGARQIAMPVDAVDGIHAVYRHAVLAAPATLSVAAQSVSTGVIECGQHRAGLLDPERLQHALAGGIA